MRSSPARPPEARRDSPVVSVILTACNVAPFIEQAAESALRQTHTQLELIIVDDGSTDGSAEKADALTDPRVRVIHQRNAGSSAARNAGIEAARGRYLAFLDGDDYWLPEKVARQVALLESHPEVDLSFSLSITVHAFGNVIGVQSGHAGGPVSFRELLIDNPIRSGSSVVVRTEAMKEAGGFDPALRACTDYDGWLRVARLRSGNTWCIPEPLDYYRRRTSQTTSDWRRLRDSHRQLLDKLELAGADWSHVCRLSDCHMHRYFAYIAYEGGQYGQAARLMLESLRLAPVQCLLDPRSWMMTAAIASGLLLHRRLHRRLEGFAFKVRARLLRRALLQYAASAEKRQ